MVLCSDTKLKKKTNIVSLQTNMEKQHIILLRIFPL